MALYLLILHFTLNQRRRSFMSAQRFQGKVAVVTGGNSGIGLGVAKAYAQEGAQVAITGRNGKTLEEAAKEIGDGNPRHSIGRWQSGGNRSGNEENQGTLRANRCTVR
jgi:NAD(P)-dependent dehydrogenase (short-subunit alcohol dehydrogenase family)